MLRKPLLAIVGRPNVGKSTLYNRFVGGRPALVHDTPGLTRDRRYGEFDYYGAEFRVVDTGGLDPEAAADVIGAGIHRQAEAAMLESDAVLFVLDARVGLTPNDYELADKLRKLNLPIFCIANKIDSYKKDSLTSEIYELGLGEVYPVSAAHGRGADDVMDAVVEVLTELGKLEPKATREESLDYEETIENGETSADRPLRIAFVGKPNAGKSSLMNRLIGSERSLVHHEPGTTTDPVDSPFEYGGRSYVLIDTAGVRRRAKIYEATEKIAVSMALGQIKRADIAVLMIDAKEGASIQDARLAGAIEERGCALVVALNKCDLLEKGSGAKDALLHTEDELHFLNYAPKVMMSVLHGDGVEQVMTAIDQVAEQHRRRITTGELNRFFQEICETHPPPVYRGKTVRVHYLTQARIQPPTFLLWANRPDLLSPSYRRYLLNQMRKRYGFAGTPLKLVVRAKRRVILKGGRKKRRH